MQFNTRLLHAESSVPTMHGEILPPVSQVSAFRYDTTEELERVFHHKRMGYAYTRIGNPTITALERKINELEGGAGAVLKQCCLPDHLTFGSDVRHEIELAAICAYPNEACGILLGHRETGTVEKALAMENRTGKGISGLHYRIDPLDIYRQERRIEKEGYDMMGFFHSHVEAEAILSDEDEGNMIPGMIYAILPVFHGKPGRIQTYGKTGTDGKATGISIRLEEKAKQ